MEGWGRDEVMTSVRRLDNKIIMLCPCVCICTIMHIIGIVRLTLDSASLYLAMSLLNERTSTIANMADRKMVMTTEQTRECHWMLDGGALFKM